MSSVWASGYADCVTSATCPDRIAANALAWGSGGRVRKGMEQRGPKGGFRAPFFQMITGRVALAPHLLTPQRLGTDT